MAILPSVTENSAVYTLVGPDNTKAVINDETDPDYVGTFDEDGISGLDDPDVRENAWEIVEGDGGVHGNFWYGRRPITMSVQVLGTSISQRNTRMEKLKRATNALRGDGQMIWTPTGGMETFVMYRKNQPRRESGQWLKTVFVPLVAADPRKYSSVQNLYTINHDTPTTVENQGDFNSPPQIQINGPGTDPDISNGSLHIRFTGLTLSAGDYIVMDLLQRTIIDNTGASVYGTVDFLNTTWWLLTPGNNTVQHTFAGGGATAASTMQLSYRHAWI